MKIVISLLNFRPGLIGGAETYIRRLIDHLPRLAGEDRITLLAYRDIAGSIRTPGVEQVVLDLSDAQIIRWRLLEAFTPLRARFAEREIEKIGPGVVFFPQQSMFPKRVEIPRVLTVLDIQHVFYPQYFSLKDRAFRAATYPYSLRQADHCIAISEYTRKTVMERYGLAVDRITAVPFGITRRDTSCVSPPKGLPLPYLYYPAATFPHKDHATLFRTYAALKKEGDFPYELVLTGNRTRHWAVLSNLIRELGVEGDVLHLGFLRTDEVDGLYRGAEAILFPSRFEGFGLPVLEATEFDKKIITSRLEVFDEIGVPRKFQIDFSQPRQLREALALPGPTRLEKPPWTWTQVAQATLDILRRTARK